LILSTTPNTYHLVITITEVSPTNTTVTCSDFSTWTKDMPAHMQGLIQVISDSVRAVVEDATSELHNIVGGSYSIVKYASQAAPASASDIGGDDEEDDEDDEDDEPEDPPRFQFSAN